MFVDRMAVFLWVTSSDKLLQVDHFKPNFVLSGWQHPETSEMSSCSRTKHCPRIMCWVIPVVYLTVSDILMVPWRYLGCLLSKSWAKCEPMTVDGALARLIQPVQKKKCSCSCSSSNSGLIIIQGWLKEWAVRRFLYVLLFSCNGKVVPEVNRAL